MKKYIKYLISLLLIFGLTVNECSIYSQVNTAKYHQVSYASTRKEINSKYSKLHVYARQILSKKALSIALITYHNLQDIYSAQVKIILKLLTELYQKINSIKAQHIFLSKTITSSNYYSALYIA